MKETLTKRLANLLSVKSLVTIALTVVFAYNTASGNNDETFNMIYTTIIGFYFGYQAQPSDGEQK